MTTYAKLDDRLVRALCEGANALPDDLTVLRTYLRTIEALLAEKAVDLEPTWAHACAAASEIETLQSLEVVVVERVISVSAADLAAVLAKLQIWRDLCASAPEGEVDHIRNRLIRSVETDVGRLARLHRA